MTALTGTRTLLRFHLRRDRLMLAWWILGGVLLYYSQGVSVDGLYSTQAEFDRAAAGMESNVAFIAMAGPARALNTTGGQVAWQASAFGAILAGLMSMFLIGRHTRAEEESGRDELIRASVVGRHAPLVAAALVVVIADALLGVLVAASLIWYGLPIAGSVSLGLAVMLAGLVFGAVALVAVQLTQGVRTAYGITGAVIGVAYALRAVGDVGDGTLSWLSPIGWGQAMRAYADEIWWPALLSVVAVAVLGIVSARLSSRRDVGSGVWPVRPGPARGSIRTAYGLAWRLQRGSVLGWTAGMLLGGIAFGSIGQDVGDLMGDSQFAQDVFGAGGGSVVDSFYAAMALMLGLIASGYVIGSVLRLRGEEDDGHAEPLLATALSRTRWAGSHLLVAAGGGVVTVLAAGVGLGVGFGLVTGDSGAVLPLIGATAQYVAPVLALGALAWLAYALRAPWGVAGWCALGFCIVVMLFGSTLRFPDWLTDLSPFQHLATVPAEDFAATPFAVLLGVAALLVVVGLLRLRHRDIT